MLRRVLLHHGDDMLVRGRFVPIEPIVDAGRLSLAVLGDDEACHTNGSFDVEVPRTRFPREKIRALEGIGVGQYRDKEKRN